MIVVDASAVLDVVLRTSAAGAIEARLFAPGQIICAPHLIDVEVAQTLRRYSIAGKMDAVRGQEALDDWLAMVVQRYSHDILLQRIWELRDNISAYDAAYVALAENLDAPLLTRDGRLANAPRHSARIEVV